MHVYLLNVFLLLLTVNNTFYLKTQHTHTQIQADETLTVWFSLFYFFNLLNV